MMLKVTLFFFCCLCGFNTIVKSQVPKKENYNEIKGGHGFILEVPHGEQKNSKPVRSNRTKTEKKPHFKTSLKLTKLGNNYYYFPRDDKIRINFFEAVEFCRKNDMHLLSLETEKENNLVKIHLGEKLKYLQSVWTSGNDLGQEGEFVWMSTGMPFNFTNWESSEPNNYYDTENCVHIFQYFKGPDYMLWNDNNCTRNYNVICETSPIDCSIN